MNGDYILLSREDINDFKFSKEYSQIEAWLYLINEASPDGKLCCSIRKLALIWGWNKNKVDRFIKLLESAGKIKSGTEAGQQMGQLSICNYGTYVQRVRQRVGQKRDSKDDVTSPSILDLNNGIVKGDGWRNNYEQYKSDLRQIYVALINDPVWMAERQRLNPGTDIKLSLEKACIEFWSTEEGWRHKKKSTKKGSSINWKTTLAKAVSFKPNKVYEQRNGTSRNGDSSAARGISDKYKAKILRDLGLAGCE